MKQKYKYDWMEIKKERDWDYMLSVIFIVVFIILFFGGWLYAAWYLK